VFAVDLTIVSHKQSIQLTELKDESVSLVVKYLSYTYCQLVLLWWPWVTLKGHLKLC